MREEGVWGGLDGFQAGSAQLPCESISTRGMGRRAIAIS